MMSKYGLTSVVVFSQPRLHVDRAAQAQAVAASHLSQDPFHRTTLYPGVLLCCRCVDRAMRSSGDVREQHEVERRESKIAASGGEWPLRLRYRPLLPEAPLGRSHVRRPLLPSLRKHIIPNSSQWSNEHLGRLVSPRRWHWL